MKITLFLGLLFVMLQFSCGLADNRPTENCFYKDMFNDTVYVKTKLTVSLKFGGEFVHADSLVVHKTQPCRTLDHCMPSCDYNNKSYRWLVRVEIYDKGEQLFADDCFIDGYSIGEDRQIMFYPKRNHGNVTIFGLDRESGGLGKVYDFVVGLANTETK